MTIFELFSGIGSQARALNTIMNGDVNVLGTCEWDIHAFAAYDAIHNGPDIPDEIAEIGKQKLLEILGNYNLSNNGKDRMDFSQLKTYSVESLRKIYAGIVRGKNVVDITTLEGRSMPRNIDILTYSFPCQDLSNVGAFHGYNRGIDINSGSRSSLIWQVGRILQEMKDHRRRRPRFLLMENVPSLLSERHRANFERWINDLEDLGYISKFFPLNAHDFGMPQNRPRLLMISVFVGNVASKRRKTEEYFHEKGSENIIEDYTNSVFYNEVGMADLLRTDYTNEALLAEALDCNPNDTVSRREIWNENPQLVLEGNHINPDFDMIRTITTKQDRNPNSGNLYFNLGGDGKSMFRYLTPRECLLFMGFTDEDYENIVINNPEIHVGSLFFPRDKIIRLAGNSIPIKLLEGIFLQIKQIDEQVFDNNGRA